MTSHHHSRKLAQIVSDIHDHWLDLQHVVLEGETLCIPLTDRPLLQASEKSSFPWTLRVNNVEHWYADDAADVGYYDVTDVKFDIRRNLVQIICGVPLEITAKVGGLDLMLEKGGANQAGNRSQR